MVNQVLSVQWFRTWFPIVVACSGCAGVAERLESEEVATTGDAIYSVQGVQVSETIDVEAPASCVWEAVGNFNGWRNIFPAVEESRMYGQGIGAVRFLKLKGTAELVVERQDLREPLTKTLAYTILESSLPVSNYHATIQVKEISGNKSRVAWSASFLPSGLSRPEAKQFIRNFFQTNLEGLAGAFVPKVVVQKVIAASASEIWSVVGDFNGLPAYLGVLQSSYLVDSGSNKFRIVTFADGVTTSVERLDHLDESNYAMTYSAMGSPFGLTNYVGRIAVLPKGDTSLVTWSVAYIPLGDPAEAQSLMLGALGSGLDGLCGLFSP